MVKTTGYIIFFLSCLLWALILVVPWMGFTKSQLAWILSSLVIAGEITFYLSVFLLGKTFIRKIRKWFSFRKTQAPQDS
jgi:hypothetical protein